MEAAWECGPFGPAGGYRQAGEVAAAVYNTVPVKRSRAVEAADVFPELRQEPREPEKPQTREDALAAQQALAAAWGS